jgi:hypothetical protein
MFAFMQYRSSIRIYLNLVNVLLEEAKNVEPLLMQIWNLISMFFTLYVRRYFRRLSIWGWA